MTDQISDLLIRIKNASDAGHERVVVLRSKFNKAILELLSREGFVGEVAAKGKDGRTIDVALVRENGTSKISGVERISKPSKRVYFKVSDVRPIRQGFGILVLSTPKGVMTDREARKEKVGGEALFKIW